MNEERVGLHGWRKWVVVIAALMTFWDRSGIIKDLKKSFMNGYNSGQPTQIEPKQ